MPYKTGIFFTDRARYQRLKSKGKIQEIESAFVDLSNTALIEGSYKNINIEQASFLQQEGDTPVLKFWGSYYAKKYYEENNLQDQALFEELNMDLYKVHIPASLLKVL
jgi:hypothetical protein